MQLKNRPHANRAALAPFAHFTGLPSSSTATPSGSQINKRQNQTASQQVGALREKLMHTILSGLKEGQKREMAKEDHLRREITRAEASATRKGGSLPRSSGPMSTARASKSTAETPFADAMRGYTPPSIPAAMKTHAAGLTDRQKTTATLLDAQAASQRVASLNKELSDAVWDAALAGKRANPAELTRLRGQLERAEATAQATMREAMEAQQCALARKSSAVRAALTFPEQE